MLRRYMRGAQANGEQIQSSRRARGLTQEQLASLAGIDVKTVRKAERGRRIDLGTITKISFALEVAVCGLVVPTRSPQELEIRRRDAVLHWHRCWDARDMEGLLSIYHDDAVLHLPGGPDIPFAGEHRGKEAIRSANEIAWARCESDPVDDKDFNLLVSDDAVILNDKKGVRLPGGEFVRLMCLQIFTFSQQSDIVLDHRVEYDTLTFARLVQLPISDQAMPTTGETPHGAKQPPETSR
jgi:transcriptional regulator with XRE-family HTH domain